MCQAMSDRDRIKTSGDAQRVREHVRKVLARLAAFQEEKRIQERATPNAKQDRG
jgi:hypothetical protein